MDPFLHPSPFPPCLNLAVIKESFSCQTHGQLQISQFVGGGNRNQASRGGGPWRLIGNGPPVNVNGNQGFVQLWLTLYTDPSTQDKLSPAVTLLASLPHPLHLYWKGKRTGTKEARKNGGVRQQRNTKGGKKRGAFDISNLPVCSCLGALVMIWKGTVQTHKHQKKQFSVLGPEPACESHHEGHFLFFQK